MPGQVKMTRLHHLKTYIINVICGFHTSVLKLANPTSLEETQAQAARGKNRPGLAGLW